MYIFNRIVIYILLTSGLKNKVKINGLRIELTFHKFSQHTFDSIHN